MNTMKEIFLKTVIFIFLAFGLNHLSAQQAPEINFEAEKSLSDVTTNNFENTIIQFAFEGLDYINVETRKGIFTQLIMPNEYSVGDLGTPRLPASKNLIEIPFGAEISVEVNSYTTEKYHLSDFGIDYPIKPVQPSLRKDQDVDEVPFRFESDYYNKTDYIVPELASIEDLGVMRGQRLGRLTIAPVQYNPAEETIKVYNNIEVEIQYSGSDRALTNYIKASTYSPYFEAIYDMVINPFDSKDLFYEYPDLTKYPIKMVIVSHPDFEETLQPYIDWKTKQGYEIIEAYTDDIGSSASDIQDFIHGEYNAGTPEDPAPTFVIVVGDPDKLPASAIGSASGQVTDLYYASVDGDYFADMYLGRLSARNEQELQNQLDKILYYQQYEFDDPSYLNDVTLIAGSDATWNPAIGQPTVQYGTENYFNTANGFNNVNAYLTNYSGCYDEERISVSLINYTAHCNSTSWGNPNLSVGDVHNMTNEGKYPLAIGNCCMSAQFGHSESIGEAWVRAENKGGVAYIGSAPNTHWFEDFYWAVGAFPIQGNNNGYVPDTAETTIGVYDAPFVSDYRAVASKKFVGNLAITEAHQQAYPTHSNVQWYWEGYHTFGDPSTVIYLTEGSENTVDHMDILPIGLDFFTVSAEPGSYVGISKDGVLHGAALVDESGEVDVPIDPVQEGGDVTIVVTKPQYIPYIQEVPAAAQEGPYVTFDYYEIDDSEGNNNNQADYGEFIKLDVSLKNVGKEIAENVEAEISTESEYVNIIDNQNSWGDIEDGESVMKKSAFSFEVKDKVPNNHSVIFKLNVTDAENNEWESSLSLKIYSPQFTIDEFYVDNQDNNSGKLDPGEIADLVVKYTNTGGATAMDPVSELSASNPYFTIHDGPIEHDTIPPGEYIEVAYNVEAHPSAPEGTFVDILFSIEDGNIFESEQTLVIGQVPELVIGDGNLPSNQYPFYNFYKANRSQMIYLADELGEGEKTIIELAFDIINASSSDNNLPNFVIRMMHIEELEFTNDFIDTDDAIEVFTADFYEMPLEQGWEVWELQEPFEYDGESNLLVEVVWGQLPDWTFDHYEVASTAVDNEMVAYGYSDTQVVPTFDGTSDVRPNLWLAFDSEHTETKTVNYIVKDNEENLLENAGITIGSLTKHTDDQGTTNFDLAKGTYLYKAGKEGYSSVEDEVVVEKDITIEVILERTYIVTFNVEDNHSNEIENAVVTLDGEENEPGDYVFKNLDEGKYEYKIEKEGYLTEKGEVTVDDDITVDIILYELYTVVFNIKNEWGKEIKNAKIIFNNEQYDPGEYVLENIVEGTYSYKVEKEAYFPFEDNVTVDDDKTVEVTMEADGTYIDKPGAYELSVFPNPARDKFFIESSETIKQIRLIDGRGQILKNIKVGALNTELNVSTFNPGVYYMQIHTNKKVITKPVQINR